MKRYARLGFLIVLGASLSACSGDQKWKEEVQLSDGKIIVVERELLTEGGGDEWALNRSGSKPKEYRIRFEYPIGSSTTVEWRSTKKDSGTWPELPMVLDIENNEPILFSNFYDSVGCHIYIKYIYRTGGWIEEHLPPVFEKRTTNLQILNNKEGLPFIDLEHKRKKNSDARAQDYKQVGPKHPYCR